MSSHNSEYETVVAAVRAAWEAGCPVAGAPEETARAALRRWHSFTNRGVREADLDARIRDLAKGLMARCERDLRLVGPLALDYEHLARCIATSLLPVPVPPEA